MEKILLPIDSLRISPRRHKSVSAKRVEELRWELESGKDILPIRVQALGDGTYVVRDGRHRIYAHLAAGITLIEAVVENIKNTVEKTIRRILERYLNVAVD